MPRSVGQSRKTVKPSSAGAMNTAASRPSPPFSRALARFVLCPAVAPSALPSGRRDGGLLEAMVIGRLPRPRRLVLGHLLLTRKNPAVKSPADIFLVPLFAR